MVNHRLNVLLHHPGNHTIAFRG